MLRPAEPVCSREFHMNRAFHSIRTHALLAAAVAVLGSCASPPPVMQTAPAGIRYTPDPAKTARGIEIVGVNQAGVEFRA
jgi:hypothetical protein